MELRHLCVSGTSKASVVAVVAGRVLQAEACLVSLSHTRVRAGVQQVVMAEFVHAVVVPVDKESHQFRLSRNYYFLMSLNMLWSPGNDISLEVLEVLDLLVLEPLAFYSLRWI